MTQVGDDAEVQALRTIRRRKGLRNLLMALPVVAVWFILSSWAARHWDLRPSLVRTATLLIFVVAIALMPRRIEDRLNDNWRETSRMRLLFGDRAERGLARARIWFIVGLAIILVAQIGAVLTPGSLHARDLQSDTTIGTLIMSFLALRWQASRIGDEGAQWSYLVATSRAFLVTLSASMVAVVMTADRGPRLLPAVEAALVLGCLTWQVSMAMDDRQAARDGE